MRRRLALLAVLVLTACSEERATPVDLDGSATTATPATEAPTDDAPATGEGNPEPGSLPATPHAIGESPQARAYAEQQCLTDPTKTQGVIRIVDPTTDEVVGEVIVDCAEVRAGGDEADPAPSAP